MEPDIERRASRVRNQVFLVPGTDTDTPRTREPGSGSGNAEKAAGALELAHRVSSIQGMQVAACVDVNGTLHAKYSLRKASAQEAIGQAAFRMAIPESAIRPTP